MSVIGSAPMTGAHGKGATLPALIRLAPAPAGRLALASLLGALTVAFGVGLMATAGYLISRAAQRPAVLSLTVAIVVVRFFGIGRPLVRYLERLCSHDLALRALGAVRSTVYERIEPLAPAQLSAYRRGDLLSRMVADVDALQSLYLSGVEPPLVAVLAGGLSVGVAWAVLPAAGLVLAGGLLAAGLVVPAMSGALVKRSRRRDGEVRGRLSAELVEALSSAPELAVFGAVSPVLGRIEEADTAQVARARRDAIASGMADGLAMIVTGATVCAVLAVCIGAPAHSLDPVLIGALALLALASFDAVTPLSASARELTSTRAAGRRILELTDQTPDVRDPAHPAEFPDGPLSLALDRVSARYPEQPDWALHGVSFTLGAGERVALLGPSGAGKTTVANLLLRFLDPDSGRVTVNGRDLREFRMRDIRGAIAVAGQESHLFAASIGENVRLGRPDAEPRELEEVLRRTQIWDWIDRLPDGLETPVGELGRELSGGQRQRLVVARALLARTPVLILDEPTAHLDPATARELMDDLFRAAAGRTVLLITHRTEGLDQVDRVVRLERMCSN